MDLQLQGCRAVVAGSASGIGWGIALRLAQEGASVVIHGRMTSTTVAFICSPLAAATHGAAIRSIT